MSLSKDINLQQDIKECFICENEILGINFIQKEGMYFHARCYEEQIAPPKYDTFYDSKTRTFTGTPETNVKFIEEDICPLINNNLSNNPPPPKTDQLLLKNQPHFNSFDNISDLGPEIVTDKKPEKKVTFSSGKIPAVKLEYEDDNHFKQFDSCPKNTLGLGNTCIECGKHIDFSNKNTYVPFDNDIAELINYSDNIMGNFNKIGEELFQNPDMIERKENHFYIHICCVTYLQNERIKKLNQEEKKKNEIPKNQFDEVMNIMNFQKGEEVSSILTKLTTQITNMNNVLQKLEQKLDQNLEQNLEQKLEQQTTSNYEQNRRELLGEVYGVSVNQKKSENTVNIEQIRESILQTEEKISKQLMEFERFVLEQENKNNRRHKKMKELLKKIEQTIMTLPKTEIHISENHNSENTSVEPPRKTRWGAYF